MRMTVTVLMTQGAGVSNVRDNLLFLKSTEFNAGRFLKFLMTEWEVTIVKAKITSINIDSRANFIRIETYINSDKIISSL